MQRTSLTPGFIGSFIGVGAFVHTGFADPTLELPSESVSQIHNQDTRKTHLESTPGFDAYVCFRLKVIPGLVA